MGYYTDYTVSWDDPNLETIDVYDETIENGDQLYSVKWYEHDSDMKAISQEYPNVKFTLTGTGEEPPDFWKRVYLNGENIESKHGEVILLTKGKDFTVHNFKERFKAVLAANPNLPPEDVLSAVIDEFGIEEWE